MQSQQQEDKGGHMHDSKYSISLPYPEIKVESKNPFYAQILQNDYAGIVSELTAVNQYTFYHLSTFLSNNFLNHICQYPQPSAESIK